MRGLADRLSRSTGALCSAFAVATAAAAEDAVQRVVVTAGGAEARLFDVPWAAGLVDAQTLRGAGPMVQLSEALVRVPGLVVRERHNHAQDLQIHSRGFGARATFGVRGIALYADGIPAAGPDGQGQVSHFDLAGAQRIEVLRGPFSALYGPSSGGVIALVSASPLERRWQLGADLGSHGLRQWRAQVEAPFDDGFSLRVAASRFTIDGFRPHSSAERTLGHLRLAWDTPGDRVVLVAGVLDQPAQDPLGLTRALFEADPDQTVPAALPQSSPTVGYDTRKRVRQQHAGLSWRHQIGGDGALREARISAHLTRRAVVQWQSIPFTVQAAPTHPGGVIDFDRLHGGADARLVWRWTGPDGLGTQLVAGVAAERSLEDRRGFENFVGSSDADRVLGVTGALRRDERNRVGPRDVYAQAEVDLATDWTATLGLRHGRIDWRSRDAYIVPPFNGDDSGARSLHYTNPVAALQWRASPSLRLYLAHGRGFESPTLGELFYRPDGQPGLNLGLQPQTSGQWEAGLKWRPPGQRLALDLAVFDIRTDDEIGVAASAGGRASFRNLGRTLRQGAELDLRWQPAPAWRGQLAASWLDARHRGGQVLPAGRRIAGTQRAWGYAEWAWLPAAGLEFALEARAQSDVPVADTHDDFAEGHALLALRARWQVEVGGGRLELLARLDNLADRRVAGSVIVNESQRRHFEPAPGRTALLSLRWSAAF